jgi:hypothetical protein
MVDTSLHLFKFAFFLDEVQQISVNTTGMGPERCQIIEYSRFTGSAHSDLSFCGLCYTCSLQFINYAVLIPANCTDIDE